MIFATMAVASTVYSVEPLYTLYFSVKALAAVCVVAIVVGDSLDVKPTRRLLNTFYLVFVLQWVAIMVCFFLDPALVGTEIPGVGYSLNAAVFCDYGMYATVCGVYLLSRALAANRVTRRLTWALLYAASLYFVLLSRTRSMVFAAFLGCAAFVSLNKKRSVRYAGVTVSVLAALSVYPFEWHNTVIDFVMRGQSTTAFMSLTGRANAFDYLLSVWHDSPLTGYGYAAGSRVFLMSFVFDYGMGIGAAHDALSKVLVELGIAGCVVLLACVVAGLLKLATAFRYGAGHAGLRDMWQHALALMLLALVGSVVNGGVADVSFPFLTAVALCEVVAAPHEADGARSRVHRQLAEMRQAAIAGGA
jgi:O-antigen ligase